MEHEYIPNRINDPSYIRISDSTLRFNTTMTNQEELEIARQLAKLRVDVIEVGSPTLSRENFESIRMIAKKVGNNPNSNGVQVPVICGFVRCNKAADIYTTWEAVKFSKKPRMHIMGMITDQIRSREEIAIAREMVSYSRSLGCSDIEFGVQDVVRSDKEHLYEVLGEVIRAGTTTIDISDTKGYTLPSEFGALIADLKSNTPGIENVIISTHCCIVHGLSTANTLAGSYAGVRQAGVSSNNVGEKAGNASLEEVVMAIKCRGREQIGGLYTGIDTHQIVITSKMVAEYSRLQVQPYSTINGFTSSFAHSSDIALGKHSGQHELESRLLKLGIVLDNEELEGVFLRFKEIAKNKKYVSDDELQALFSDENFNLKVIWSLGDVQVSCGTLCPSTATVKLLDIHGAENVAFAYGTGPIDAAYKAIDSVIKVYRRLFHGQQIDAVAFTRIVIRRTTASRSFRHLIPFSFRLPILLFSGAGAQKDIVVSSIEAYINALNKMLTL
ncbi:hypothetical protein MKX03_027350 [Papaver bracteatum]|nr:hypothetical protein MKX03_027350 [Papaver bracteatum]